MCVRVRVHYGIIEDHSFQVLSGRVVTVVAVLVAVHMISVV